VAAVKEVKPHKWSEEEKKYLMEIVPGRHYDEVLELMNARFDYQFKKSQLSGAAKRYGVKTGFDGRYKKGNVPPNKGTKGLTGANKTSFKKGHQALNYRPIGSERICRDGYTEIKVADPNKWKLKHRLIWEEANGPVPKGYALIFGDGDKRNIKLDNLLLVSRAQLARLNQNHLIQNDTELTKTAINVVDLMVKISKIKKGNR
jgi:hypothetical protein